jgi:hypothetical protein
VDDKDQPPASVSDQNREQSQPGQGGTGDQRDDAPDKSAGERKPSGGESGEGSQSTGDPKSAG